MLQRWALPLALTLVERARGGGLPGATVFGSIKGSTAPAGLHTTRVLLLSDDLPIVIQIIEGEDCTRALLHIVDEMLRRHGHP